MPKSSYSGKAPKIGTGKVVGVRTGTDRYLTPKGGSGVPLTYQAKRKEPQALPNLGKKKK